jgi:hypothetical protein
LRSVLEPWGAAPFVFPALDGEELWRGPSERLFEHERFASFALPAFDGEAVWCGSSGGDPASGLKG